MSKVAAQDRTPRFSIVSAVYNVARYLDDFIESIEAQTFPLDRVEVIMVNDGSTDNSLEILEAWQRRRPDLVTVLSKANGGQATARNAAFEHVHGEWVTFTDPDDMVAANYLAEVDAFLRKWPSSMLVATNRLVFNDGTGEESKHPLHVHFVAGVNRFRNLDFDSGHFHGHASGSFFRADILQREQIRFDPRLRTTFEDGHFCNVYLLRVPEPLVGYVSTATYKYRKRDDGSSTLDRSWMDPGRFTNALEHGLLDLLRAGAKRSGRAPTWLQGMVLYELFWYFRTDARMYAPTVGYGEVNGRFHELFDQICELLDEQGIDSYFATRYQPAWRDILLRGRFNDQWHTDHAVVDKLDAKQNLMRITYRFTGELPDEMFVVYSGRVEPVHQKIRDVNFFGRPMLQERIVWVPFGTLRVVLDGRDLDVRTSPRDPINHRLNGVRIQQALTRSRDRSAPVAPRGGTAPAQRKLSRADKLVLRLAAHPLVRFYFGNAWVLIDRIFNADDSAEHLFLYLRKNRPGVNAWFVIERGTDDDRRIRRLARGRVVAHGSLRWKLLMLNCQHLISSHADEVIVRLPEIRKLIEPQWRFTFLQHGVTKDDLSTWLNAKNIDIFVTSTYGEQQSVVGDHTTYRYTTRESKLTGLPRFDRILEEGNRFPPEKRDLILVAPTWRQWLTSPDPVTGRHRVDPATFGSSEYAIKWNAFINSPELRELAERTGVTLALLLHPNLQETATLDTPPYVKLLQFEGANIQQLFARARVLVTDYSSMFFNAAYIERPIVYFQFDRDRVLGGWHVGRRGYFDYERDGFGPVTFDAQDAVAATVKAVDNGPHPESLYVDRINASFPERDGRCCERVANEIALSTLPTGSKVPRAAQRPTVRSLVKGRARGVARRVVNRSPHAKRAVARLRSARAARSRRA